jgi:hypothetical protein
VGGTTITTTIPAFTSSVSSTICGSFGYTITYSSGSAVDTTVFTVSNTALTVATYSVNVLKAGTYTIEMAGY